jgi:hypothetical protein
MLFLETTIVNMHHTDAFDVKIDRSSIFGNPFYLGTQGDRDAILIKYRTYFLQRIDRDIDFRQQVLGLRNKRLACWCSPKRCHGEVIVEWLNANQE